MDNEDACFEFRQERDLMYRTHLYYLDYDFSQVSIGILISGQVTLSAKKNKFRGSNQVSNFKIG